MGALTKADLAATLANEIGLSKLESKEIVETFFEEICNALKHGDNVKISGFGVFALRDKSSRPGRNPRTGEEHEIEARRVVTFHASGKLKDHVANFDGNADNG